MGIDVISRNPRHSGLARIIGKAREQARLTTTTNVLVVAAPPDDNLGDQYLPADADLPHSLVVKLVRWGVSLSRPRAYIILRHKPIIAQMVKSFFHEYRHHWQHEVLPPETITLARQQNWVDRCSRCRFRRPAGYLPAEADAEVFAYRAVSRYTGNQRQTDMLFGAQLGSSEFFTRDLDRADVPGPKIVQSEIEFYAGQIAHRMAHHQDVAHQDHADALTLFGGGDPFA